MGTQRSPDAPLSYSSRVPPPTYQGRLEVLYTAPPAGSLVVNLDEMGPESAKSFPGHRVVRLETTASDSAG